ncbi:MAG: NUDIX hydrolase [Alphaproteobacteria bacterium]|nr:NUDIX hydrolase [Alphaproteobacteria bacterium]
MFDTPPDEKQAKAPRIRNAATLIIQRREGGRLRLLMGQRHEGHAFMPGKIVFPGGRIERHDSFLVPARNLKSEERAKLAKASSVKPEAVALAAIRETFEETGILIGEKGHPRPPARGESWRAFLDYGVTPSLDGLRLIARAITPPYRPRRFDARFFTVDASHIAAEHRPPEDENAELLAIKWVTIEEARAADLPEITRRVIDEIEKHASDPASPRPTPFFRVLRGKPLESEL